MKGNCAVHGETDFLPPNASGDSYCRKCVIAALRMSPPVPKTALPQPSHFSMGCRVESAPQGLGLSGSRDGEEVRFQDISLVPAPKCEACGNKMEPASSYQWRCTTGECAEHGKLIHTGVMPLRPPGKTYRLARRDGHLAIQCLKCGLVSHNPGDVEHRYCGRCHEFHDGPS